MYMVTAKDSEIPIYTIKPEGGKGHEKRVHRNNIMNCNLILPKEKDVPRKEKTKKVKIVNPREDKYNDSDSDEENVIVVERHDIFEKGEEDIGIREDVATEEIDDYDEQLEVAEENEEEEVLIDEQDIEHEVNEVAEENEEEEVLTDEQDIENEDNEVEQANVRPQRTRKRATIFTYDTMGNPTYRE